MSTAADYKTDDAKGSSTDEEVSTSENIRQSAVQSEDNRLSKYNIEQNPDGRRTRA